MERRHFETDEPSIRWVDGEEIHHGEIAAERLVAADSFVIVEEIAATIENESVPVDVDAVRPENSPFALG